VILVNGRKRTKEENASMIIAGAFSSFFDQNSGKV